MCIPDNINIYTSIENKQIKMIFPSFVPCPTSQFQNHPIKKKSPFGLIEMHCIKMLVPVVDIDIASSSSYVQGNFANYNRADSGPASAPLTDFRRKHKRDSKLALAIISVE